MFNNKIYLLNNYLNLTHKNFVIIYNFKFQEIYIFYLFIQYQVHE